MILLVYIEEHVSHVLVVQRSVCFSSALQGVWERTPSMWTTGQRTGQQTLAQITSTAKERWCSNPERLAKRSG